MSKAQVMKGVVDIQKISDEERKKYIELLIKRLKQIKKESEKDSLMQSNYSDLKKLLHYHLEQIDDTKFVDKIIEEYMED